MASPFDEQIEYETVSQQGRLINLLDRVRTQRNPVLLDIRDHATNLTSKILEIDKIQNRLLLDDPVPHLPQSLPLSTGFTATSQVDGIALRFSGQIIATQCDDTANYYFCSLPKTLDYAQRREAYRVYSPLRLRPDVRLRNDELILAGHIVDMSVEGARIYLPDHPSFVPGHEIEQCSMLIPGDDQPLAFSLRVCHLNPANLNGWHAGVQFLGLGREMNRKVQAWIREMERRYMKVRSS